MGFFFTLIHSNASLPCFIFVSRVIGVIGVHPLLAAPPGVPPLPRRPPLRRRTRRRDGRLRLQLYLLITISFTGLNIALWPQMKKAVFTAI